MRQGLTIGPGIGLFSRLDRDTVVFPILVVDWDISEQWNLNIGGGLAASRGPGLALNYRLSDHWTLGFAARYKDSEFRLGPSTSAAGGIGRHQALPLVITAELQPGNRGKFAVFVGAELAGKLTLRDANR